MTARAPYRCTSMGELIAFGRKLALPDGAAHVPLDRRVEFVPIECVDISFKNIKNIFDDARKYLLDHKDVIAWQGKSPLVALLTIGFEAMFAAMRFESNLGKLRGKYMFSNRFSDRSCIARIYICGWRLQRTLSSTHFILTHNPKVHRDEFF